MDLRARREHFEAPEYYQVAPLIGKARLGGWLVAAAGLAGGISGMVWGEGSAWEPLGVVAAVVGVAAVFVVVRLRRFEVVVGPRWLRTELGPFTHRVGREGLGTPRVEAASSWRRLYSAKQVVVPLPSHGRELIVPTRAPEELVAVLTMSPPA